MTSIEMYERLYNKDCTNNQDLIDSIRECCDILDKIRDESLPIAHGENIDTSEILDPRITIEALAMILDEIHASYLDFVYSEADESIN